MGNICGGKGESYSSSTVLWLHFSRQNVSKNVREKNLQVLVTFLFTMFCRDFIQDDLLGSPGLTGFCRGLGRGGIKSGVQYPV